MAKAQKISLDQQRKLLLKPCKTRNELKAWIKYFLNLELPDVTVSRYSDTNPLDVIWEVYDICVNNNNPDKIKELLFVAGRGSGKTLGLTGQQVWNGPSEKGLVHGQTYNIDAQGNITPAS